MDPCSVPRAFVLSRTPIRHMPSAVFETIGIRYAAAPFFEWHLERLHRSAVAVGLAAPGAGVRDRMSDAMQELADGVLRVEWDGADVRLSSRAAEPWGDVRIALAGERHRGYGHKTTERTWLDRELASALREGVDEVLFLTPDGWVAEGAVSAVGFVRREAVVLPPLDLGILPSIGRQRVIDLARELGIPVRERRAAREDLAGRPVFVVNAVRGVGRVVSIGGEELPDSGVVGMLVRAFWPSG